MRLRLAAGLGPLAGAVLGLGLLSACVGDLFKVTPKYDSRQVTVQFLSLYNQRHTQAQRPRLWQGDWVLRRERLSLIDAELRSVKPDLLVLQEMLTKKGSPYDSDRNILSAGALAGYDWQVTDGQAYEDTLELESMAIATGLPLRVMGGASDAAMAWRMGEQGLLSVFAASLEGQDITVANVKLPAKEARHGYWYRFIEERLSAYLDTHGRCDKRLLVAGYFAAESDLPEYRHLLESLQLVDVSQGFCEKENLCYTATPLNDLFKEVEGEKRPQRLDRILAHQSVLVYSSQRNFDDAQASDEYARSLGIERLSPSLRYGWVATLRFARCVTPGLLSF